MERIQKSKLMEKVTGKIPDGTYFQARNLDDLLKTLNNHELNKDEIIRIVFPNQIKLNFHNSDEYNLPYFYNDNANLKRGEEFVQSYIDNSCSLISAIDTSISEPVFMYGHKNLDQRFQNNSNGEIILPKPFITFQSLSGIGIGVFNEF
jgi:hypothetical protein